MIKSIVRIAEKHIYTTTATLSLLTSLWLFVSRDIISRDAILYVTAAQTLLDQGLAAALKIYEWPFYYIVIALFHKITGFSFENSAYLITILLETVISVVFVKLYAKTAYDGAHPWVAMLFILTFVTLSDYKGDIWREYGFWAFSLMAIYQFIDYFQARKQASALLWQLFIFIAVLFRPEGIAFAALAPFYFLFVRHNNITEKIRNILALNSVFYPLGILIIATILISSQLQELILNNLPRQVIYLTPKEIFGNFNLAAENFAQYVLPFDYSEGYSHFIVGSGLLSMLLFKLVSNFNLVYLGIWLTGSYRHWVDIKRESNVIYYFAAIALLILLVFIATRLFVSTRYTVFLLLLIGLVFTQYLDYIIHYLAQRKSKFLLIALSAFITFQYLDSIITTGGTKLPIQQGGTWLAERAGSGEKIACNEKRFNYYTGQECLLNKERFYDGYGPKDIQFLKNKKFTYLVLWVKHKNTKLLKQLERDENLKLLNSYKNKDNDVSLIFEIKY